MFWGHRPYVPVAQKRENAEKKLKQLLKKNPNMKPVFIKGKSIAETWWGRAWNSNLEKYAEFSNRIGRGRSYVRHGSVLDLQISKGKIDGLVLGSSTRPYKIKIQIRSLGKSKWDGIKQASKDKIDSLQELLDGKFPKSLAEIFTTKNEGLFPTPQEIKLSCSCPDWAVMCKHVAATLYGVGARLDEDPELFFTLRGVKIDNLIEFAVNKQKENLKKSAAKRQGRGRMAMKEDTKLAALFDIDLDLDVNLDVGSDVGSDVDAKEVSPPKTKVRRKKKTAVKKKVTKKKIEVKKRVTKKKVSKKVTKKKVIKKVAKKK